MTYFEILKVPFGGMDGREYTFNVVDAEYRDEGQGFDVQYYKSIAAAIMAQFNIQFEEGRDQLFTKNELLWYLARHKFDRISEDLFQAKETIK